MLKSTRGSVADDASRFTKPTLLAIFVWTCLVSNQACVFAQIKALAADPAEQNTDKPDDTPIEFLKPLVNVELSFIKRVCKPSDEQMSTIVKAANKAFLKMNEIVQDQNGIRVVHNVNAAVNVRGPNQERLTENPYVRIRDDAAKYLKPLLKKNQFENYLKESDARQQFERTVAIEIAVDLVDEKVILSDQQRKRLAEKLDTNWKSVDVQQMQMYLQNPQYVPALYFVALDAIFTKKQMVAWGSMKSTHFSLYIGNAPDSGLGEDWIK